MFSNFNGIQIDFKTILNVKLISENIRAESQGVINTIV